jgi:hypothetical protein
VGAIARRFHVKNRAAAATVTVTIAANTNTTRTIRRIIRIKAGTKGAVGTANDAVLNDAGVAVDYLSFVAPGSDGNEYDPPLELNAQAETTLVVTVTGGSDSWGAIDYEDA